MNYSNADAALLLNRYYDMPAEIAALIADLETLSAKAEKAAFSSIAEYYQEEITLRAAQLRKLQREQHTLDEMLMRLTKIDRRIVELAYLGPKDPKEREKWLQRPTWYAIGLELGCSEAHARIQGARLLQRIAAVLQNSGLQSEDPAS